MDMNMYQSDEERTCQDKTAAGVLTGASVDNTMPVTKTLAEIFYENVCEKNVQNIISLVENNCIDVNKVFEEQFVSLEYKSWTALHIACKKGHNALVWELLQMGADPTIADKKGETPLHIVCKHGHTRCVEILLKHDLTGMLKDKKNKQGLTPLCKAVYRLETAFKEKAYCKTIELLIEAGCDVNLSPVTNMTPLHIVAQKWSRKKILEKLIKAGANVNAETAVSSPLMSALCRSRIHPATVVCLIDAGANVNYRNQSKKSVLHVAVAKSEDICVKHLLQAGADTNVEDADGNSPLWIAVSENNITITPLLLEYGGNVNFTNRDYHMSLLCKAVNNSNKKITNLLLDHNANIDMKTALSASPLHYAVDNGDIEIAKLLLQRNCAVDNYSLFKDIYNPQNALEIALSRGDNDIVKLLLRMGFPVNELNLDSIVTAVKDDEEIMEWIMDFVYTPRPLLHLCRVHLRRMFGIQITKVVDTLTNESFIPKRLASIVLMEDVLYEDVDDDDLYY